MGGLAAGSERDATNMEANDGDDVTTILDDNDDNNIVVNDKEAEELL